jgi:DNA polymerase
MRVNQRTMRPAFLDFETQSCTELTTVHKYAKHESTRALTCVVKVDGQMHKMGPYLKPEDLQTLQNIAADRTMVAHNAPFDAAIWELTLGLPEAEWFDTLPAARAAGFPGRLDDVSRLVTGRGKDPMGGRLIQLLCIIKNGRIPAVGPAHDLLMEYNVRDVEELEAVYQRVKNYGEPDVIAADAAVNARGIPLDRAFAERLRDMYKQNREVSAAMFEELAPGVNPGSSKQMKDYVEGQLGFSVPGMNKTVYKEFLQDPEKFYIGDNDSKFSDALFAMRRIMEARRDVVRVGGSKIDTALEVLEDDGRVRDQHVYWGAGPGRWSGRQLQMHNMPSVSTVQSGDIRGLTENPTFEYALAIAEAETRINREKYGDQAQPVVVSDVLSALIRHMVRSERGLLVADYGSVELRGTAYLAGCQSMLTKLADPKESVYLDTGLQLFGKPITKADERYSFCKALVLGSTYGMSGRKFEALCKMRSIKMTTLLEAGLTAADSVKVFRSKYPELPRVWREFGQAAMECANGGTAVAGRCVFERVGDDMHMVLPSGRPIVYRNVRIEMLVPGYCKLYGMPEERIPTVVYDSPRKHAAFLYGSKVCENAVQGMCRDFLAAAIVNCESEGLHPILHVHDELVCEDEPDKQDRFMEIMSTPPPWAPDFPLLAEGYAGSIWTKKQKAMGYKERNFMNGRPI